MRCAGQQQAEAEACGTLCCVRVTTGALAGLTGALFLVAAAANYIRADNNSFLHDECGAPEAFGGEVPDLTREARPGSYPLDWCTCDDVMPLTRRGGGYGGGGYGGDDQCMLHYGTDEVQHCCESAYDGAAFLTFLGAMLSFLAPMIISGGWLPVCGVLCDCREAFASCNRVVTDEPTPCCWRDCTMIWVTPVWLMSMAMLPLHAVKTDDFDGQDNAEWLYIAVLLNVAYMVLTAIFTINPCVPPGHDTVSRQARLTGKLLNQWVCAGIGTFCFGLFFALLAFATAEEKDFSMPCCYCVRDGQADLKLLQNDPTGNCQCHLTEDGTLVQQWMYGDYESSMDPSLGGGDAQGTVSDGGDDMYDGGNYLSTSRCSVGGLAPYTTGMSVVESDCFGPHGQYRMDLREAMMVVVAKPGMGAVPPGTGGAGFGPWDFIVSGNLGADGNGEVDVYNDDIPPQSGLKAFAKTVCSRQDPSITHLIVVEDTADPLPHHSYSSNTDSDLDQVRQISPRSGLVYVMAAKRFTGRCPTREDIVGLFSAVVAMCTRSGSLGSNTLAEGCGWLNWGGESGEAALSRLEQSWTNGHSIDWDLDKLSPPTPPAPLKRCTTPGIFYRFSHATSAPLAIGDYYYHVSNVYGGGRSGRYTGQHEWRAAGGDRLLKTTQCGGVPLWVIAKPSSSSSAYSEDGGVDADCWSRVGTNFDTPPEVGWTCIRPDQRLCDQCILPGQGDCDSASSWRTLEGGLRLRASSFCIGDDMNRTTSQCPGGDQSKALSDVSGAMDGWENCESGAATLALSVFGQCGGRTTLVDLLSAYLSAAQDTAGVPQSMEEAGLDPLATFQDVCCETCPPPPRSAHGTFEPSGPQPSSGISAEQPWQQQNSLHGIHPSSCPDGGNGGHDVNGKEFFSSATTFLSLMCINAAFFLVGHFQGCCCSRFGSGSNAIQTEGRCSMVFAVVAAWALLTIVDFCCVIMLISDSSPEAVYILCVLLPCTGMLAMFNAHHCSLQAPVPTVQAVVTTSVMDFQMAPLASSPSAVSATVVRPISTEASVGVPMAHASASRQAAVLMPSLGEALIPTTGFSLESDSGSVNNTV